MSIAKRSRRGAIAGSIATYASLGILREPLRAAQFEFKCGSALPAEDLAFRRLAAMWAEIEKESGGRIHAQLFPGSALGSEDSMLSQVRVGALQFQFLAPAALTAIVPSYGVAYLGFAFRDAVEGLRTFDGPMGDYVRRQALAKGIYTPRSIWNIGMGQIGANPRPIRTPDDLHGFKPRVSGTRISIDLFKELGANATAVSLAETYTALQTHLVDGVASSLVIIESARWYEVVKYISLTNHAWYSQMLISSADVWNRLPPDLQDIVERNNTRYSTISRRETISMDVVLEPKNSARGIAFNPVDQAPFRQRLHNYYQTWSGEFGPTQWGLLETTLGRKLT